MSNIWKFLLLSLISLNLQAVELTDKEIDLIHKDIRAIYTAMYAGKTDIFLEKTHPSIYRYSSSGKAAYAEYLKNRMLKQIANIKLLSMDLGKPNEIYTAGPEEICFIPRVSTMELDGKTGKSVGFMIAIRNVGGNEWSYLDGTALRKNSKALWNLFPKLQKDIQFPENRLKL